MAENPKFFNVTIERDSLLHQLNESRKAEEYTDVKLQTGDKLFPAHRAVLSNSSPFLKALISDQWSTTNVCPLSDQCVDPEIMEDLLTFLYTGSITLTPGNVHPICVAADFLQIPDLLEPSSRYLRQFITVENVLTFYQFSIHRKLKELNYACLLFVSNNHGEVFQNPEILEFSFKDFKDLIVGMKKFWSTIRENIFHCIVRWTEKDRSKRLDHLPILLKTIPLEELSLNFLSQTVSNHPVVKDSISAIETVSTALANHRAYSTNPPWMANQRMIVLNEIHAARAMRLYDSGSGVWSRLPDMPSTRTHFGVAVVNHQDIIVCGGFDDSRPARMTASVEMFDWTSQTWMELPAMPAACANASAAFCDDHLYVVGSYQRNTEDPEREKRVLRYSFETQQWSFVASLNKTRAGGRLIEHKNCLYAFGGDSKTIEKYDPARDKWTIVKKGWAHFGSCSGTLHQGQIYIYGLDGVVSVVYHPETNGLDDFPKPPIDFTSLVSLNGKLLAVGGMLRGMSDLIYEFDFPSGNWVEFGRMNSPSNFHSTVVGAFH